jgi:hypothetical protein
MGILFCKMPIFVCSKYVYNSVLPFQFVATKFLQKSLLLPTTPTLPRRSKKRKQYCHNKNTG